MLSKIFCGYFPKGLKMFYYISTLKLTVPLFISAGLYRLFTFRFVSQHCLYKPNANMADCSDSLGRVTRKRGQSSQLLSLSPSLSAHTQFAGICSSPLILQCKGLKLFASLFALRVIVPVIIHPHRVSWASQASGFPLT